MGHISQANSHMTIEHFVIRVFLLDPFICSMMHVTNWMSVGSLFLSEGKMIAYPQRCRYKKKPNLRYYRFKLKC